MTAETHLRLEVDWTIGILSPSRNHSEQYFLRSDGRLLVLRVPKSFSDSFLHASALQHLHPILAPVLRWHLVLQHTVGYDEIVFDYVRERVCIAFASEQVQKLRCRRKGVLILS